MKIKYFLSLLCCLFVSLLILGCHGGSSQIYKIKSSLNHSFGSTNNVTNQHWHYTYNSMKLLETATDPNGNVTRYEYDGQGNVTKITNALKQSTQLSDYTSNGNPQIIIDANGVLTKNTYTIDGWLSSSITDGAETKFEYDSVGQLTKITKPDGSYLKYVYDGARRLVQMIDTDGSTKYSYDNASNKTGIEISGASGLVLQENFIYDQMNRLTMDYGAFSNKLRMYEYDNDDNIVRYYKEGIGYTDYSYDSLHRVVNTTTSDGAVTKYEYNNLNNVNKPSAITDARDNKTIYNYNGVSNLLKLVSPDSGIHNNTAYDGNGNLLSQIDARGEYIYYSYDALDRPVEINYANDSSLDSKFTYDNGTNAVGRLTNVQNGISSNSYSYDASGNVLSETQFIDKHYYTLHYGYDKADNLTNIVYPSNNQVVYTYENGRVVKVMINGRFVADISHLPFGPINKINYGNNIQDDISYDTNYIQTGYVLSSNILNRQYKISNGNINGISGIGSFFYNQGRLSLFMNDDNSYMQFFYYDYLGNFTSFNEFGGNQKIQYQTALNSNRIISKIELDEADEPIITTNYLYDNAGNLIKSGNINYIYDGLNRLSEVTKDSATGANVIANYEYNSLSQRIVKRVDGNSTVFIYNSGGQLLEERNSQTNVIRDYVYVEGKLIAAIENGLVAYIVTDHLNAPQLAMDSSGKQIWRADYQPYGQAKITGYYKFNLRADGQYQDDETGLYYNWYRYYNPDLGRYITSDPLGLAAGMNTYIYVNGNPINYTDPQGLCPWCVAAGVVAVGALEGAAYGVGTEILIQAAQHKTNFGAYDRKAIGYAGLYGTIPGGAGAYMAKRSVGAVGMIVTDAISNGFASGLQTSVDNYCSNKDIFGENMTQDQLYGTGMGALGSGIYHGISHNHSKYGSIVGEVFSNGAQGIIEYNKRENNK